MNAENQAEKEGAVEAESLKDRWSITELLDKGYTHREIKNMTGISFMAIKKFAYDNNNDLKEL